MLKLKHQYKNKTMRQQREQTVIVFPNVRSYMYKKFSTKQEKSFCMLHLIEYKKYSLNIRAYRGNALPDCYDDYSSYVYKVAKSWKHNSKRYHQYK